MSNYYSFSLRAVGRMRNCSTSLLPAAASFGSTCSLLRSISRAQRSIFAAIRARDFQSQSIPTTAMPIIVCDITRNVVLIKVELRERVTWAVGGRGTDTEIVAASTEYQQ